MSQISQLFVLLLQIRASLAIIPSNFHLFSFRSPSSQENLPSGSSSSVRFSFQFVPTGRSLITLCTTIVQVISTSDSSTPPLRLHPHANDIEWKIDHSSVSWTTHRQLRGNPSHRQRSGHNSNTHAIKSRHSPGSQSKRRVKRRRTSSS